MPAQETFLTEKTGERSIEVLKSYDQSYAREAFGNMSEDARQALWESLKPEEIYDAAGLPRLNDPDDVNDEAGAFLWDELVDQARERDNLFSFFIVNENDGDKTESLYVSPDWPSAEAFAKSRISGTRPSAARRSDPSAKPSL